MPYLCAICTGLPSEVVIEPPARIRRPYNPPGTATAKLVSHPPQPSLPTFAAAEIKSPKPPPETQRLFDEFGELDENEDNAPDAFLCPITHVRALHPAVIS